MKQSADWKAAGYKISDISEQLLCNIFVGGYRELLQTPRRAKPYQALYEEQAYTLT